ncbi:MAG: 3-oxoacyl-[acyl-carrier-protein] synthase III C-terminal domain-containing protein [Patescibacteria group bacterium]
MIETERFVPKETEKPTASTAVYTPPNIISNDAMVDHLTKVLNVRKSSGEPYTADDIERVTGISERHYCTEIGASPLNRAGIVPAMGTRVALEAFNGRKDWDYVDDVFASTGVPYKKSLGKEIAENLRASGVEVVQSRQDVYAECTSPVWILNFIRENEDEFDGKNILMVASEYGSPVVDGKDKTLPSDAATAIAFTYGKDLRVLGSSILHQPDLKDLIRVSILPEYTPPEGSLFFCEVGQPSEEKKLYGEEKYGLNLRYMEMDGRGVFNWLANPNTIPPIIDEACEIAGVTRDEIDVVIPHQANGRVIDIMGGLIGIDQKKIVSNIRNHGNCGSATTMLAWHEAVEEGLIKKGSKVLVLGFGAGMMAGAALVEVN